MSEYIGIIVKNQWDDILLYDYSFYIKAQVKENEDVNKVIKKAMIEVLDKDFFKIIKIYDEKINHRYNEITMYLVEVGVYTNDFEFMNIEKLQHEILNFEDKEYFKKNILKYDEYITLISTLFNFSILVLLVEIIKRMSNTTFIDVIIISVVGFILTYTGFSKYIKPKIDNQICKFKFNPKSCNTVLRILIIFYCIKSIY